MTFGKTIPVRFVFLGLAFFALENTCRSAVESDHPCGDAGAQREASQGRQETSLVQQEAELREALRREPNNAVALARLGKMLAIENKSAEAQELLEKAIKLNPGDLEARRNLATSYYGSAQLESARKNFEVVLKAHPDDSLSALLLGMVSEDLNDHARAAKLLGGILPLVQQRPESVLALAKAYYHLGEPEKARGTLQLLMNHPAGPQAAFQGGRLAAKFQDYGTAEKAFAAIQQSYPDRTAVNYNLALAQYSAKKYEETERTLKASIAEARATPEIYALLGWTYAKQDRLQEMLTAFEKAINDDPGNPTHFLDLGNVLIEKKNYGTAMEVAKEAVKRYPGLSRAHSLQGSVELHMYLLSDALKSYARAVELDPNDPKAALGYALALWNMDRNDEAARAFEEGSKKFASDAFFQLKYALFLVNAPGDRDAAQDARIKKQLKRAQALDDSDAETHFQLASLAMKENNYKEAEQELLVAAKLDPELSKVHFLLARVYRRTGRNEEAEKQTALHRKLKEAENQGADTDAAIGTRHP